MVFYHLSWATQTVDWCGGSWKKSRFVVLSSVHTFSFFLYLLLIDILLFIIIHGQFQVLLDQH